MVYVTHTKNFGQIDLLRFLRYCSQYLVTLRKKSQNQRSRPLYFLSVFSTLAFVYTLYPRSLELPDQSSPAWIFDPNTSLSIPLPKVNRPASHLILLWTDLFLDAHWHQRAYLNQSILVACSPKQHCQFTRDRESLSRASAVAFHLYDSKRSDLPERVTPQTDNQTWIFITGESPVNFYYQNPTFLPYLFDNYFDRAISYRYDSPYSIFAPSTIARNATSTERALNRQSLRRKSKPIAWMVSNCVTFSHREKYVAELQKYIAVDIFGRCGQKCAKKTRECQMDLHEYYFYLSFENSRCQSYISEKFWNIVSDSSHRLVPVVMGGLADDYARIAPKQSYINVNRFPSPKELAAHLHDLIKHPERYLEYLQWRETTEIRWTQPTVWSRFFCPLCQMSYEKSSVFPRKRLNFSSWFNPSIQCHEEDVRLLAKCKQVTLNVLMGLRHRTKCP